MLNRRPLPHHVDKADGLGDSLPSLQSCMPHHIVGMFGGQLIEQPLITFLVWADDHNQVAHMPAMGKLQKAAMVHPNGSAPIGECSIQHGTQEQKAYTRTDINTYKHGGRLNSERETYLWERPMA